MAGGLEAALEPLGSAFSSPEALQRFFGELGWNVAVTPASMGPIRAGFAISSSVDALVALARQLESDESGISPELANSVREAVVDLIETVKALSTAPPGGLPAPFDQAAFWDEVPVQLADFLLLSHLQASVPGVFVALRLTGLAEIARQTPSGAARLPYVSKRIRWDRIGDLITDPVGLLKVVYGWDQPGEAFQFDLVAGILQDALHALNIPARQEGLGAGVARRFWDPTNPALAAARSLEIPLITASSADRTSYAELGLELAPIPPAGAPTQPPVGFAILPLAEGTVGAGTGTGGSGLQLIIRGGFDTEGALGAEIRPSGVGLFADAGAISVEAELLVSGRPETPWILLGDPEGFRIEAGGFEAGIGIQGQLSNPEVLARIGTGRGTPPPMLAVVIQASEADGFIGKLIGSTPLRFEVGGSLLWSSRTGLHVEGSGGFEYAIPLHLNLGIAEIETLTIGVGGGSGGLAIEAGITGKGLLGPLTAVVEEFGLRATLNFGDDDGNLGPVDVGIGFKPPNGVGLSVDAGVVKGGGYLYFDFDKGEYAGALELSFSGIVELKAIGLVSTKLPDGSPGFSLLIIITAEFGAGFQLGYGFKLIGVGGLLGINRTMRLQPLMEGVRTGAVNSIMFPTDVIANAPKIISDLKAIFPPQQGTFLIGPMAKLGWGTPTLVSLSLGIIIEIPGNLAILGVLKLALPTPEEPIVVIQVSFAGAIEFDRKRVYFFASLFGSRVLFMTLEGDMALVAAFGDDAVFVLSVGGFHPRFEPPPLPVPTPQRLALSILDTDYARIRVEAYFAVTSNTLQFGAHAQVFFGFDAMNVNGEIGFDALIQFSPFYFIVEISASFSVSVFGIGLLSVRVRMSLEGPTPWRARGTGSVSLLFFDVEVEFDETWGEDRETELEPVAVMPLLDAELDKAECWRALPPGANADLLVSLRRLDPEAESDSLVLHPRGTLHVSQRAVPLDLTIDRVGNRRASDATRFSLQVGAGLAKRADVSEQFAPAQFLPLTETEKLSRPSFERQHGGVELAPAGDDMAAGAMVKRINRFELITIDTAYRRRPKRLLSLNGVLFAHFLGGASIAHSSLSQHVATSMQPFEETIAVTGEGFAVARQSDNTAVGTVTFASEASARDFLAGEIDADPNAAEELHVIPAFELAA